MVLPRTFYERATLMVARDLLGARLVRNLDGRRLVMRGDGRAEDLLNLRVAMAYLAPKGIDYEELDARYANRVFVRGWKGRKL